MSTKERPATVVITDPIVLSYVAINEPKSVKGGEAKYGASLIIPKSNKALVKRIEAAIDAAKEAGKDSKKTGWGGKIPKTLDISFKDGDEEKENGSVYENCYYIQAYSKTKPEVIDLMKKEVPAGGIYSGMIARVSVNFYPYGEPRNGIAAGLNNVQKVKDGTPLAGKTSASDDFDDDFEFEDDDDL